MTAPLLTVQSSLSCPHGGTVSIVSSNTGTQAGAALALATDTFTVSGCPFQLPTPAGPVPHPCTTVQWVMTNTRCTVGGTPTLSATSMGLCLAADQVPQGPVVIASTQTKASGG